MLELIGISFLLLIILLDPYANFRYVYYGLLCLAILFFFRSNIRSYSIVAGILILVSILLYFFKHSGVYQPWVTPVVTAIMLLIAAVPLAPLIQNWADTQGGVIGFVVNVLWFIPCLLHDLGKYLWIEFQKTPRTVWTLLGIIILGTVVYFQSSTLIAYLLSWFHGKYIQKDVLRFGTALEPIRHTRYPTTPIPMTHFTISFWLYQNEPRKGNAAHTILNCGGRPHIQVQQNQLLLSNSGESPSSVGSIPLQKWTYVTLVYDQNICNVFIDGIRVHSASLRAIEFARTHSEIWMGDENVFGDGAICLFRIVSYPMTRSQIQTEYLYGNSMIATLK
jgi:hypothetical protein